jgi:subtilisin family serine protease
MKRIVVTVAAALVLLGAAAPALAFNDPLSQRQWNLAMIEAEAAHPTTTGSGAVVAIIDSGVHAAHEDLQGRLLPGRDIIQNDADPQDENGHGTHVLGTAGASSNNGAGIASVAPGARYMPVRVLDEEGAGSDEHVAKGIDHAVGSGADVINLSLGDILPLSAIGVPSATEDAIRRALDAGVVVVAASGNNGLPLCEQPSDPRLICVGSVDKRRVRSMFSSNGDLMAPGGSGVPMRDEDILSSYIDMPNDNQGPNSTYIEIPGTSQAAPHVAGVAALLVSLGLRGEAVKQRLLATATDAGPSGPDMQYGAGILNARAAVSGLGPSGGAARGRASTRRRQRARTLLRRGLRVRCTAPAAGRCTVTAEARGKTVMFGSRRVRPRRRATVVARATRAGRRMLRRARRLTLRVHVAFPGAPTKTLRVRVRR